jgi:hypothetical protein
MYIGDASRTSVNEWRWVRRLVAYQELVLDRGQIEWQQVLTDCVRHPSHSHPKRASAPSSLHHRRGLRIRALFIAYDLAAARLVVPVAWPLNAPAKALIVPVALAHEEVAEELSEVGVRPGMNSERRLVRMVERSQEEQKRGMSCCARDLSR